MSATLRTTFDGVRCEQIDLRWARELGGLEAYVFDGEDIATEDQWRTLAANLRYATEIGAKQVTMHFPTENADWVNDPHAYDKLRRFCDLAAEAGAPGIVLHANQFVRLAEWPLFDLAGTRERVVAKVGELDSYLAGSPIWVGVENMPIIGAQAIDFDSIFVRPADFAPLAQLNSERIGVTWDVCHWAVSYTTLRAVSWLEQRPEPVPPLALPPLPIKHIHFASFAGHAMPTWPDLCVEGVPPQVGDIAEDLLADMLVRAIDAADQGAGIVLEVQEDDYRNRENCWRTYEWITSVPELARRVGRIDERV